MHGGRPGPQDTLDGGQRLLQFALACRRDRPLQGEFQTLADKLQGIPRPRVVNIDGSAGGRRTFASHQGLRNQGIEISEGKRRFNRHDMERQVDRLCGILGQAL